MGEAQIASTPHTLTPEEITTYQHASFEGQRGRVYPVSRSFTGEKRSYNAIAAHAGLNEASGTTLETILASLKGKHAKILDIGCGIGIALAEMKQRIPDASCIGISAEPNIPSPQGITIKQGDAQNLPETLSKNLLPQQYDFITAVRIAEHLIDPLSLVESVYNALAPRGRAFISHFPVGGLSNTQRQELITRLESCGLEVLPNQNGKSFIHIYIYKGINLPKVADFSIEKLPPKPVSPFKRMIFKQMPRLQYKLSSNPEQV